MLLPMLSPLCLVPPGNSVALGYDLFVHTLHKCNTGKHKKRGRSHKKEDEKERKVYAIRHHDGRLCTQRQPELQIAQQTLPASDTNSRGLDSTAKMFLLHSICI